MNGEISINETQVRILDAVLRNDAVKEDGEKVGVTSYSLSKGNPKIAIGTWNDNYNYLEKMLLITRINESKPSGRGNKNFSITPIGIILLINKNEKIDRELLQKIFQCCFVHYERGKFGDDKIIKKDVLSSLDKVLQNKKFDVNQIQISFHDLIRKIMIFNTHAFFEITLIYNAAMGGLGVQLSKLQYFGRDDEYSLHFDINKFPEEEKVATISKEVFYYFISKFILCSFPYYLFGDIKWETNSLEIFIKKEKDVKEIQELKNKITKNKKMLNLFDEKLIKIINSFQADIENAIEYHLRELKKIN